MTGETLGNQKYHDVTARTYIESARGYIEDYYRSLAEQGKKEKTFVQEWQDDAVKGLPKDARIFDIGSGPGQDADYLLGLGYTNITLSDVAPGFVEFLQERFSDTTGIDVIQLDIIRDNIPVDDGECDLISAGAVLLHFRPEEAEIILNKMIGSLKDGGRIAFSVKEKTNTTEDGFTTDKLGGARYFHYYTEDEIKELLERVGLSNVKIERNEGFRGVLWLSVICDKKEESNVN